MTGKIDSKYFFFKCEQLLTAELSHRRQADLILLFNLRRHEIKDAHLAGHVVLALICDRIEDRHIDLHKLLSRSLKGIERACLDQIFDCAPIKVTAVSPLQEILYGLERPPQFPLRYDLIDDTASYALDRIHTVANLALLRRESAVSGIHRRRQNGYLHVPAVHNVLSAFVRVVYDGCHESCHELYRMIVL